MHSINKFSSAEVERLFTEYLPKAKAAAGKYHRIYPWVDSADFESVAITALWKAVEKIDFTALGSEQSSFVSRRINWSLIDELRRQTPDTMAQFKARTDYVQAVIAIEQQKGRAAELAEVQAALNMADEPFREFLALVSPRLRGLVGPDDDLDADRGAMLGGTRRTRMEITHDPDMLADENSPTGAERASSLDTAEVVRTAVGQLKGLERDAITAVYLGGQAAAEFARSRDVSKSAISQAIDRGLKRLRVHLLSSGVNL